jgi:site-specific DNA-methyltransferase (adenine-specific)/site-specific DNA-methyltransferase (cytosine-N4-specific)
MTTTKPTDPITVTYMPLEKLIRAPRNPKDHDIGSISNSMTRFGFTSPMLMNEKTGRIVAGHGRLDTLQRMKAMGKKPPGRILEKDGQWLVPVIRGVSFENEQEAEAYLIADNRLVEVGGWDEQEKAQILADLAAQGEEMLIGIGFDMQDVDELLKQLENEKQESENGQLDHQDNLPEEKDLPEAEMLLEKWGVQEGDVWNVADSYLLCGDAREQSDWQTLLDLAGTKSVGGIFTSPPYAMQRAKKNVPGYDGIPEDQYVQWWDALQQLAYQYLEPQGSFFLNIKPNVVEGQRVLYVFDLVLAMCRQWNWCLIDEFCWERAGNPGKWPNRFKNGFEPVYQFSKQSDVTFFPRAVAADASGKNGVSKNRSTGNYYNMGSKDMEWDEALPSNRIQGFGNAFGSGHPAAFPVGLPNFFIKAFSNKGDFIIDPFAGSGTVAVAAIHNERRALMIDKEEKYVAVMLERLSNLTGQAPTKVR